MKNRRREVVLIKKGKAGERPTVNKYVCPLLTDIIDQVNSSEVSLIVFEP